VLLSIVDVGVRCRTATRRCILRLRKVTRTWLSCYCSEEPMWTVDPRTTSLRCTSLPRRTRSQSQRSLYDTSRKLTRRQRSLCCYYSLSISCDFLIAVICSTLGQKLLVTCLTCGWLGFNGILSMQIAAISC